MIYMDPTGAYYKRSASNLYVIGRRLIMIMIDANMKPVHDDA